MSDARALLESRVVALLRERRGPRTSDAAAILDLLAGDPVTTVCALGIAPVLASEIRTLEAALADDTAALFLATEQERLHAEIQTVRGQVRELLPYAAAGADALDFREPYGMLHGDAHDAACDAAATMLDRIRAGEFGPVPGASDA